MSWLEILCVGWALAAVVSAVGWAQAARRRERFDDYAGWGRPRRRR